MHVNCLINLWVIINVETWNPYDRLFVSGGTKEPHSLSELRKTKDGKKPESESRLPPKAIIILRRFLLIENSY